MKRAVVEYFLYVKPFLLILETELLLHIYLSVRVYAQISLEEN